MIQVKREPFCHVAIPIMVVINAGRQLLMICVHKVFLLVNMLIMSAKMLSVPSDRGRQTYRSENVQTVMGILCPATVRPAPVFVFLHGGFAGYLSGNRYRVLAMGCQSQRYLEVKI